ncbi:MAG: hypothetical protein FWD17_17105 [Polyangiaceae bacterium]|nr:hypothetical protein [Polyangiaceae bacterium]
MGQLRKGPRGLPAIAHAREERSSKGPKWTTQAGLAAAGAVVAGLVAHTVVSGRALSADRRGLLAKQRAVASTLGAEWFPLRDALETHVLADAREYSEDRVTPAARTHGFRSQPGLYLRMRVADASSVESIRKVAADAKKDAFAACFLREPNELGKRGEVDGGAFSEQPWNLGQAYAATRLLTDAWVREVTDADEPMRLRVFSDQYDKAVRDEIPLAIDVVKRAQFFLLVLDEDVPEAASFAEGGPLTEAALQLVAHPARVFLYDLRTHEEVLRLRRSAEWQVVPAGERAVTDPETIDAMKRQANNCALASSVESAIALSR